MGLIKKAKRGFTLVELVVVIAVIAVLAAVSVGAYFGITESANKSKLEQEARGILNNIQLISNGNDSNSYMDKDGVHIKDINAYEARLNEMSGMTYDVVTEEPATISRQTVWFINTRVDEPSTQVSLSPSSYTTYYRFGYYTPDVGGKIANYSFLTNECEIISKNFNIEKDENEEIAPDTGIIYATYFDVPSEINVKVGTSTQLIVENVTPSNGKFFYEASSNNCFEFEPSNGSIRGISQGTGFIRVYANEFSKTVTINVNPQDVALTSMTVKAVNNEGTEISNIDVGGQFNVQVGYIPENTTQKGYTIDILPAGGFTKDPSTDKYTAVKPGDYTIKATSNINNAIFAEASFKVNKIAISEFNAVVTKNSNTIDAANTIELRVNESINVAFNYGETNPTDPQITYTPVGGLNVTLNNGIYTIKATEIGDNKVITFRATNERGYKEISLNINVVKTPITSITLSANGETTIEVGNTVQLSATCLPANHTPEIISYVIQNNEQNIVSFDTVTNTITGLNPGTVTVKATVYDDENRIKSNEITIRVNSVIVKSIVLSFEGSEVGGEINIDEFGKIDAQVNNDATDKSITYKVSNDLISIDENGNITVNNEGRCGEVEVYAIANDAGHKQSENTLKIRVTNYKTIYFIDQHRWNRNQTNFKTYAYIWNSVSGEKKHEWPGIEMSTVENIAEYGTMRVYSTTIDFSRYDKIIFANAYINNLSKCYTLEQTIDIDLSNLNGGNNLAALSSPNNENKMTVTFGNYVAGKYDYSQEICFAVYLRNDKLWDGHNIKCHYWIDGGFSTNWPGEKMHWVVNVKNSSSQAREVYRIFIKIKDGVSVSNTNLIFSANGSDKTGDLKNKLSYDAYGFSNITTNTSYEPYDIYTDTTFY